MLRADHLHVSLGGHPILRDVSVAIAPAQITGILGPNGSGKTTLLKTLGGMLTPSRGDVSLDDAPLARQGRAALAQRLAVVPQETLVTLDYTALEVVLMGRYPHLGAFEFEGAGDMACAEAALAATGTASFATRAFNTLSGGEKQRVMIASALAQLDEGGAARPATARVLLLDEPTAALDLKYQLELGALLQRLHARGNITIVLTTHDLAFARRVCTDLVLLAQGQVLAQGPPADVLTATTIAALYGIEEAQARAFAHA
jgi:iron complex transport system ATP-binding protein